MSERTDRIRAELTLEEKAMLVAGADTWTTRPVERLGLPPMKVTDGPNGARGDGLLGTGTPTACIPSGSALGATWDPDLVEELGSLLGAESRAKQAHVLLAPTINLHRSPKGGRNFECYSEDPFLTGTLAAAFVRGVQAHGVATTPKHFVGNDSEFERNTIDVRADERTLREVYLLPFEMAVKDGGAWGMMSSYNRVNGTYCSEHEYLLNDVLRGEWGFDGMVVSDWFASASSEGAVAAHMTLEMPGPGRFYGRRLLEAVQNGSVDEAALDPLVDDLLRVMERTGVLDGVGGEDEKPLDRPEDRALIRSAAAAGSVLLRNDGILPLDASSISSIAVIGPNALDAKVMGGGSANVRAYHQSSPLAAIKDRLPDAEVTYSRGADIDRTTPPLPARLVDDTVAVEYVNGHDPRGDVVALEDQATFAVLSFGSPAEGVDGREWSARISGRITPEETGPHHIELVEAGRTLVRVDGEVVIDATADDIERGDAFFSFGSVEIGATIDLVAGEAVDIEIEYDNRGAPFLSGFTLGLRSLVERDLLAEAEQAAASADIAVVVVGTNDDWETEGRDRDLWELPGGQPELIQRVAAANERTIVVMNVGAPHAVDWIDDPAAVLSVGFAGQEIGDAIVDMLLGVTEPSGRAATTIAARYEQFAAYLNYPGENSVVRYGEGVFTGHRWHDALGIEPAVPFGHGLGYTTFDVTPPATLPDAAAGDTVTVAVQVTNTGTRRGAEVVQLYVEPRQPELARPVRELKAFEKIELDPGETATVTFDLGPRAFAYYDPADADLAGLKADAFVPAATGGLHRTEPGWYVDAGSYGLAIGRSSRDIVATVDLQLTGESQRLG